MSTPLVEVVVEESEAGTRLDALLVRRVPGMSRSRARALAEAGKVKLNGHVVRKGVTVRGGDRVTLDELPPPREFVAAPDPSIDLPELYVDAHILVVDKPAGIPSHPLRPQELGTAANALVAKYPELAGVGYSAHEPGILHRLDTDTSGALLVARDTATFEALREALRAGRIDKHYVALCAGTVYAPQTISYPLAPHPKDRKRVLACVHPRDVAREKPRPALTEVIASEHVGDLSLVEVVAKVAGRHQVRAHLEAIGHPLAGDELYAGPRIAGLTRHCLHASSIAFDHPHTGKRVTVKAPLPLDMQAAVERARES